MAYADLTQLKADYLPDATSAAESSAVARILDNVSAFVDTYCKRAAGYFTGIGATPGNLQKIRVAVVSPGINQMGTVSLQITAAGLSGSPRTVSTTATIGQGTDAIATNLRAAAAADSVVNAFFTISGTGSNIDLEKKTYAVNDATMSALVFAPFFGGAADITQTSSTVLVPGTYDAPTEKRLRGEGRNFLRLPVHIFGSIESVKLNGTVIDSANYYESDKNGWLYEETNVWSENDGFDPDCPLFENGRIYKVTARWGYAVTPLDLQEAVRETVTRLWETQKGTLGQITPNGFVIERALPLFAREVLNRYKKREFEI